MATWKDFEAEAPELAQAVRARFEAARHHVLATLRADGSPRVSGTGVRIEGGELTMGSMPWAVKARDLQRDSRCAIHANPGDGSMDGGDAKVTGVAVEIAAPDRPEDGAGGIPPLPPRPDRSSPDRPSRTATICSSNPGTGASRSNGSAGPDRALRAEGGTPSRHAPAWSPCVIDTRRTAVRGPGR